MAEPLSDERLDLVLASIGDHLVVPTVVDAAPAAGAEVAPSPRRRRARVLALAAALAVVLASTTVAPVRGAVAAAIDWLDIGSTRLERVAPGTDAGDPTGLLPIEAGLRAVSAAKAERALGRPLPRTSDLAIGDPELLAIPPEGGVLMVWEDGATTLWLLPSDDPGVVRTQKLLDEHDTVEPVAGLGEAAVFVDGDHVLTTPNRRLAADRVLLWIADGLEHRLESNAPKEAMLTIAHAITP